MCYLNLDECSVEVSSSILSFTLPCQSPMPNIDFSLFFLSFEDLVSDYVFFGKQRIQ